MKSVSWSYFFFPLHILETLPSPCIRAASHEMRFESSQGAIWPVGMHLLLAWLPGLTWQSRLSANDPWTQTQESWHLDLRCRKKYFKKKLYPGQCQQRHSKVGRQRRQGPPPQQRPVTASVWSSPNSPFTHF